MLLFNVRHLESLEYSPDTGTMLWFLYVGVLPRDSSICSSVFFFSFVAPDVPRKECTHVDTERSDEYAGVRV